MGSNFRALKRRLGETQTLLVVREAALRRRANRRALWTLIGFSFGVGLIAGAAATVALVAAAK